MSGAHTFRLSADDGDAVIFDDLTFTGYLSAFAKWLDQNGVGDENNTLAEADADMDNDGLANLFEYAVGTNGITVRHGVSTPDPDEAAVKRAMVESANFVVVVADSSKVGREEFVSFAAIDSLDVLVTDSQITDEDRADLTRGGLEVVVAQAVS